MLLTAFRLPAQPLSFAGRVEDATDPVGAAFLVGLTDPGLGMLDVFDGLAARNGFSGDGSGFS